MNILHTNIKSLLMTGWILGIFIIAAIIRFGVAAESLAWGAIFTLAPLSAVYYPVETLPEWIRWLSLSFPQTYVFEGMREVLFSNNFNSNYFIKSIILNIIYAIIAVIVFLVSQQLVPPYICQTPQCLGRLEFV